MADHRNQPLTRDKVEERLLKSLHTERIVWLHNGQLIERRHGWTHRYNRASGKTTPSFIMDAMTRMMNNIVTGRSLEKQLKQIKRWTKALQLVAFTNSDAIYEDGERLPATYANFVITTKGVICQTYSQPAKDAIAKEVLKTLFPNHTVVGVDASVVIRQHSSLHCLTMHNI